MNVCVIDVGGTEIKFASMDEELRMEGYGRLPTPYEHGFDGFINAIESISRRFLHSAVGVSICLPGIIDSERGYCISGGSLEYNIGKPVAERLQERLQVPVYLENDGKCAAMAEYWKGSLRNCGVGVVFALGTAVAGGIIIHGEVVKGADFSAGEFSYLCENPDKWKSQSATAGYLCSAVNLVKKVQDALPERKLQTGQEVFRVIEEKNPAALEIFHSYIRNIVSQLYNLQIILNPDCIAIGGGISRQQVLLDALQRGVDQFYQEGYWTRNTPFLNKPKLALCRFHNEANLIGAMYHYLKREHL